MAFTLTVGYTWTSGEVDTATKRNSAALPTIADGQTYGFGLGAAATPSMAFTGDANTGIYSPGADQVSIAAGGAQIVAVTTAGAAVTGTFSSTGDASIAGILATSHVGNPIPFRVGGASTSAILARISNTGGDAYFGMERSAGSEYIVGSSAYDTIIRGPSGLAFSADAGSTLHARLSASGFSIGGMTFGTSASKVLALANATAPSTSPAGGGQVYVESGALKYRGSSGTITTIAVA